MNEQEIIQGNKLIAEFLGYKPNKDGIFHDLFDNIGRMIDYLEAKNTLYHSSWDWLMPVVEKIESLSITLIYQCYSPDVCYIRMWKGNSSSNTLYFSIEKSAKISEKISAYWLAAIEFIEWYNQNKQHYE